MTRDLSIPVFDWRHLGIGPLRPCVLCGRSALMRNDDNDPCHKTCAETLTARIPNRSKGDPTVTPIRTTGQVDETALAALLRAKDTELHATAERARQLHLDLAAVESADDEPAEVMPV